MASTNAGTVSTRRVYQQNVLGYGAQMASLTTVLIFNLVMPGILGAYQFGMISVVTAIATIGIALFQEALSMQVIDAARGEDGARRVSRIVHLGITLAVTAAIVLAVLVPRVGPRLSVSADAIPVLYWAALLALLMHLNLLGSNLLTAGLELNWVAAVNMIAGTSLMCFPLVMHLVHASTFWIVGSAVLSYLPGCVLVTVLAWRRYPAIFAPSRSRGEWRDIVAGSTMYASNSVFLAVLNSGLVLIISALHSVEAVTYFKIALSLTLGFVALVPASRYTVFASFLHLQIPGTNDQRTRTGTLVRVQNYLYRLIRYAGAAAILMFVGQFVLGPAVLGRLYGPRFAPASEYVWVFSLAIPLHVSLYVLVPLAWSERKQAQVAIGYGVTAVAAVVAAWFAGRSAGVNVAWTYVLALTAMLIFALAIAAADVRKTYFRAISKPLAVAAPLAVAGYFYRAHSFALSLGGLVATSIAIAAVYAALLLSIRAVNLSDFARLRSLRQ